MYIVVPNIRSADALAWEEEEAIPIWGVNGLESLEEPLGAEFYAALWRIGILIMKIDECFARDIAAACQAHDNIYRDI